MIILSRIIRDLLKRDIARLEAFHMRCQRRLLNIRWYDFIRNAKVSTTTGLEYIADTVARRRSALFGHIARMDSTVPASRPMSIGVDVRNGIFPAADWKRPRGRPRTTWLHQAVDLWVFVGLG